MTLTTQQSKNNRKEVNFNGIGSHDIYKLPEPQNSFHHDSVP